MSTYVSELYWLKRMTEEVVCAQELNMCKNAMTRLFYNFLV